jgi:hypothetical protein
MHWRLADTEEQECKMKLFTTLLLFAIFPVSSTQAERLGRLFFTPEQRIQLEYNHAHNATAEGAPSSVLTVNGIVQQHGGARTVWINGTSQNSAHGGDSVAGKSQPIKIKVGEKLFLGTTAPQSSPASAE